MSTDAKASAYRRQAEAELGVALTLLNGQPTAHGMALVPLQHSGEKILKALLLVLGESDVPHDHKIQSLLGKVRIAPLVTDHTFTHVAKVLPPTNDPGLAAADHYLPKGKREDSAQALPNSEYPWSPRPEHRLAPCDAGAIPPQDVESVRSSIEPLVRSVAKELTIWALRPAP